MKFYSKCSFDTFIEVEGNIATFEPTKVFLNQKTKFGNLGKIYAKSTFVGKLQKKGEELTMMKGWYKYK